MGHNKYIPLHKSITYELICPNDGLSYFDTEYENSFYVKCHLCEWRKVNPAYQVKISDVEMLGVIAERWKNNQDNIDTPDKTLAYKYSQEEIFSKLEELDHRHLIEYGVSLRTAWLTSQGEALC